MRPLLLLVFAFVPPLLASPVEIDSLGTIIRSLGVPGITAALLWNLLARSDKRYEQLFSKYQLMSEKMLEVMRETAEQSGEVAEALRARDRARLSRPVQNSDGGGRA